MNQLQKILIIKASDLEIVKISYLPTDLSAKFQLNDNAFRGLH